MGFGQVRVRQAMAGLFREAGERALLWQYCLQFILGLSAGRFLLGGLAPFAPSFAVASFVAAEKTAWAVFGGMLLGVFTRPEFLVHPMGSVFAVTGAVLLARGMKKAGGENFFAAAGAAGGANLLVKSCFFLFLKLQASVFLGILCESLLAGLFTIPFIYALKGVRGRPGEIRLLLGLALILCGLGDFRIGPTVLREVGARGILLVAALGWGAGWGAGAGVLLGLLLGGDLFLLLPRTGLYAGTGFFSGMLNSFGRSGVILGFLLASLLFAFFYGNPEQLSAHLAASVLAALVFYLGSPFLIRLLGRERRKSFPGLPLQVEIGFSQRPKPTEPLCGDSFNFTRLTPNRLLLTVSDGMGTGINAARESRTVVKMLEQLLGNGSDPETAAGIINTALFLRGGEESGATIDLALVDLEAGTLDFLKAGAPPSFLKRGESVEAIRSSCWPAGILEQVEVQLLRRQIMPGDLLVMATDGITEADQKGVTPGEWLYTYFKELALDDAQVIADLILKRALRIGGLQHRDDMTVLVVRFYRASELE
ncbi:MAG: SpoIIE family protein phosphatase [Bacillota bacterium]|nr:SpoIIE family protein phosphatase [Bacillota bacterium]